MKNVVLYPAGVAVAASKTSFPVSSVFSLPRMGPVHAAVVISAAAETNAVTFKLQDSFDQGGTWFDVGSESQVALVKKTFAGDTAVDPTTDQITVTSHGWVTGQQLVLSGAALPTGLTAGTYYAIVVDANTLKLASSWDLAAAGTAVNITVDGSGTCTLVQAVYVIRMLEADSSDLAQLPLWDRVRVVATTGASDSVTVAAIYLEE